MKSQNILKLLACVLFVIFFSRCSSQEEKIREVLQADIDDMNKQCPILLNDGFRLDSCFCLPNNDLSYYYTYVHHTPFDSVKFVKLILEPVIHDVKYGESMSDIRSYGISLYYKYNYPDGSEAYSFRISPEN